VTHRRSTVARVGVGVRFLPCPAISTTRSATSDRRAVAALATDLTHGEWHRRNGELLDENELDLGARLLIADQENAA
jgi:hypothetical protein